MKRFFAIVLLCVAGILCSFEANAIKHGVIGGTAFPGKTHPEAQTVWSAGGTLQVKLPLGFSVQPSVVYSFDSQGSLNMPVSLQWGPDLLVMRPFVDVAPHIGYAFSDQGDVCYGVSAGGGLEVWCLQVACRYCWSYKDVVSNYRGVTLSVAFLFGR